MKKIFVLTLSLLLGIFLLNAWFVPTSNYRYNAHHFIKSIDTTMKKPFVLLQYLAPQHALTALAGWLGESQTPWLKNCLIDYFINRFHPNMMDAVIEDPHLYPSFNSFFIRQLKPQRRPIVEAPNEIASPVDGTISQIGTVHQGTLVQAKGFEFTIKNLLGGSEKRAQLFENGSFATFYLAPKDYHRVHMPIAGRLKESVYIPGDLFSVNQQTSQGVPNLFARNERLVSLFDTEKGPMAVVLVGAMLVGSIHTVWHARNKANKIITESFGGSLALARGQELGHFQMGSTVIVLFGKDAVRWNEDLKENSTVKWGQSIGQVSDEVSS